MRVQFEYDPEAWFEARPIQELKAKDRDIVTASIRLVVGIDKEGNLNTDNLPLSGGMQTIRRNALLSRLVTNWSFQDLPVPTWNVDHVENEDSIGELPIDAILELEDWLVPYQAKVDRKPTPKGTTTGSSSATSKERAGSSRTASTRSPSGTSST